MKLSYKRYKEYRRFKNIEFVYPFIKKKNVKFLKRNRFINFIYSYIVSIRKIQWGKLNEVRKLQLMRAKLLFLLEKRLNLWFKLCTANVLTVSNASKFKTISFLKSIKRRLELYFQMKLKIVKSYYREALISKELFFQENFPQELLSPHRKRRIFTYIKRLIQPQSKKFVSYSKLKLDLLYIMTSRSKKEDVLLRFTKMDSLYRFSHYYNISKSQVGKHINNKNKGAQTLTSFEYYSCLENNLFFFLYKLGLVFSIGAQDNSNFILNNVQLQSDSCTLKLGDIVECSNLKELYTNRLLFSLRGLYLFLKFYSPNKHSYIRGMILHKLYTISYNISFSNVNVVESILITNCSFIIDSLEKSILFLELVKSTFCLNFIITFSTSKKMFIVHNMVGISVSLSDLQSSNFTRPDYLINSHFN